MVIPEKIDPDVELSPFIGGYTPRSPKILLHGYGVKLLRSFINGVNRSINAARPYQGTYCGLSMDSECVAHFEYAMGYPVERVRYFLLLSAQGMLECLKLRGTLEAVEFVTELGLADALSGNTDEEKLVEVNASVDVSMGHPAAGIQAAYCAWLGKDWELALRILKAISFHPYDTECNGREKVAEYKANIHMLRGNYKQAIPFLDQSKLDDPSGMALKGIAEENQTLFTDGLGEWVERLQKEADREHKARLREALKEGKKDIAPIPKWSIWGMGLALMAMKRGLELQIEHPYIPKELLDGCV